jgi:hypothetical protein
LITSTRKVDPDRDRLLTIPHWSDSYTHQGLTYKYTMVGTHPERGVMRRAVRDACGTNSADSLLEPAMARQGLSARAYDRILKVGHTIAGLDASEELRPRHVAAPGGYRSLDRTHWA